MPGMKIRIIGNKAKFPGFASIENSADDAKKKPANMGPPGHSLSPGIQPGFNVGCHKLLDKPETNENNGRNIKGDKEYQKYEFDPGARKHDQISPEDR